MKKFGIGIVVISLFAVLISVGIFFKMPKEKRVFLQSKYKFNKKDFRKMEIQYKLDRKELKNLPRRSEESCSTVSKKDDFKNIEYFKKFFKDVTKDIFEKEKDESGYYVSKLGELFAEDGQDLGEMEYILVYNKKVLKDFFTGEKFNVIDMMMVNFYETMYDYIENPEYGNKNKIKHTTNISIMGNYRIIYSVTDKKISVFDVSNENMIGINGVQKTYKLPNKKEDIIGMTSWAWILKDSCETDLIVNEEELKIDDSKGNESISKVFNSKLRIEKNKDQVRFKDYIIYKNIDSKSNNDVYYKIKVGYN